MTNSAHDIDYEILGHDIQLVEIELDPGETVIAEAGAMAYMDGSISFETKMGDGSKQGGGLFGKVFDAGKRALAGESLFMTHFTQTGSGKARVAFTAPYPGKIMAVDLKALGGELLCQREAFLCAALGTEISVAFTKKLGAGFFGGDGFVLQRLRGDGMAFIHAGGTVIEKQLTGQEIKVDTGCVVGFTPGINYDIQRAGNLKSMLFGGEGLFLASLKGTGTVYLQSLPFARLADQIISRVPNKD
jgi:uncharacterized protein (TIGR00266 family)